MLLNGLGHIERFSDTEGNRLASIRVLRPRTVNMQLQARDVWPVQPVTERYLPGLPESLDDPHSESPRELLRVSSEDWLRTNTEGVQDPVVMTDLNTLLTALYVKIDDEIR